MRIGRHEIGRPFTEGIVGAVIMGKVMEKDYEAMPSGNGTDRFQRKKMPNLRQALSVDTKMLVPFA